MLMSLHKSDNTYFFPGREDGLEDYSGSGAGEGYNINVPWHTPQYDDEMRLGANEYKYACEEVLIPIAKGFEPDIILISCGFDSAIHD